MAFSNIVIFVVNMQFNPPSLYCAQVARFLKLIVWSCIRFCNPIYTFLRVCWKCRFRPIWILNHFCFLLFIVHLWLLNFRLDGDDHEDLGFIHSHVCAAMYYISFSYFAPQTVLRKSPFTTVPLCTTYASPTKKVTVSGAEGISCMDYESIISSFLCSTREQKYWPKRSCEWGMEFWTMLYVSERDRPKPKRKETL